MVETTIGKTESATAGEVVRSALRAEGIEVAFGIVGSHILDVFEALRSQNDIRVVTAKHETNASLMADAYSKITNRTSVILTTAGPGALNAIGGIGQSYFQASPMVMISGGVPVGAPREDVHGADDQEFVVKAMAPLTKLSVRVRSLAELPDTLAKAFQAARSGRMGPVYVEIPLDVMDAQRGPVVPYLRRPDVAQISCPDAFIDAAAIEIEAAKRPAFVLDKGVVRRRLSAELTRLAERVNALLIVTYDAIGAVPTDHPLYVGVVNDFYFGESPFEALEAADLIVTFGMRSRTGNEEFTSSRASCRIISFYYDDVPGFMDTGYSADLGEAVKRLGERLHHIARGTSRNWFGRSVQHSRERIVADSLRHSGDAPLHPGFVVSKLAEWITPETIVCLDAGGNEVWGHSILPVFDIRSQLGAANWAGMGCGLPAMVGAKVARPNDRLVGLTGDGGLLMALGDFPTLVELGGSAVLVVLNDSQFGIIGTFQRARYEASFATELQRTSFARIAESFGGLGIRVETPDELDSAFRTAFASDRPVLVDVVTARGVALPCFS